MKHGRVILETTGDVAVMTLNDPSVLNAFGLKLREDMAVAMDRVEASSARCLVITGAGRAFCSGANLNDPDRASRDRAAEADGKVKSDLESLVQPDVLAAARAADPDRHRDQWHGRRRGHEPGVDRRYSHRSAIRSFLQAFARIGLVPDCGSSWLLPRLIGMARAMELSLLAERLPAETALSWGLINRLEEDDALMPRALEVAHSLAAGPHSLGLIRQMYWQGMENTYSDQLDLEAKLQSQAAVTRDYDEGVAAFREKRPARFIGH